MRTIGPARAEAGTPSWVFQIHAKLGMADSRFILDLQSKPERNGAILSPPSNGKTWKISVL
jgi:hypothetical protein